MTQTLARPALAAAHPPRRRGHPWLRRATYVGAGGCVAALVAIALRPQPVPVDLARVTRGDLSVTVDEVARTRVRDRYVISAPLAGDLRRIELRAGDHVDVGTTVARIVPVEAPLLDPRARAETAARVNAAIAGERQATAAVERARALAAHAAEERAKTQRLFDAGSVAEEALRRDNLEARVADEELASARFAATVAAHEVTALRAALARFTTNDRETFAVTAPVTGAVLRVLAPSAGPVQAGSPLVEVGDPAAIEIVTEVLSTDAVRVTRGAPVRIERWGGPDLAGEVQRVEPSGFTKLSALGVEEQRVPIVVDFDTPRASWAALGDGFRVETSILVDERHGVLRVPTGAIFRHDGGWAVYAKQGDRAHLAAVTMGARNDAEVEVTGGLAEGDEVVVHPSERVREGTRVTVR